MTTNFQSAERKYRPDIDGLRAIAIISVIAYHAGFPGFSGGFVGVDIFFVISGFLITSLLFNEAMAAGGRVHLGAFYARRVRRLMPAGLLVVAVTLVLGAAFMLPASKEQRSLARSAMAVAFFVSNFFFFKKTGGYSDDPSLGMPLLHTWSLAVEEQYYLVWPLITLLVFRLTGGQRTEGFMRARLMWVLGALFLVSLALSIGTTRTHQNFAFFLLPTRVWEFAIGGIVGLAGRTFYLRMKAWAEVLAVVGLALIVYSVVAFDHGTSFPGAAAMLPVFGSALLIIGMTADEHSLVRRALAIRPMVLIGLLSYSWYLWHWPLLSIYRAYNLGVQDVAANGLIVALALVLACLTYVFVENPVRVRRPGPFRKVRPTLLAGAGMCVITLSMGGGLMWFGNHQNKSSDLYKPIVSAQNDFSPYREKCMLNANIPITELPAEECVHGPDKRHPRILLWGDSHADHLMEALIAALPDVPVYALTMTGCPPVIGFESSVPAQTRFCAEFNQRVMKRILEMKDEGLTGVVLSARWSSHLWHRSIAVLEPRGSSFGEPQKLAEARVEMQAGLDAMLGTLERAGLRVIVMAPTPELVYSAPACLWLRNESYCNVPRAKNEQLLGDARAALSEVVGRHKNARLVDTADFFCDAQTCFVVRDGKILYTDNDHITATAARDLGSFLRMDLGWLLGKKDDFAPIEQR